MNCLLRLAACLLLLLPGCTTPDDGHDPHAGPSAGPERVVAEVNGVPIHARQLQEVAEADRLRLGAESDAADVDDRQLDIEALQLLISGELIYQAATAQGLSADPGEVDRQLTVARSQFESDEAFGRHLEEAGSSLDQLREQAERRIVMGSYARSITDTLEIDEQRARQVYEAQRDEFRDRDQVRAAQIIALVPPGSGAERRQAALRKIEQARKRLDEGAEFADVAREFSESPFADRGGDMGFFARGRALPEFEEVVFATEVDETTPIFETPHGFNIVRVLERRTAVTRSFDDVKTGLLMVLAREQHDDRLREHVRQLRDAATIRILDPDLEPAVSASGR